MIEYYFFNTKIGELSIEIKDKTIIGLSFGQGGNRHYLQKYYKDEVLIEGGDHTYHDEIIRYLQGDLKNFTKEISYRGTEFQMKVWDQIQKIPYGETRTYKEIAENIGSPRAYRAVGGALNKNPISIIVPWHRVIGTSGKLVGFGGGLSIKERLLELEKDNI